MTEIAISILKHTNYRVVIFGHSHKAMHIEIHDKQYINAGSWVEIVNMGVDNPGRHIKLTYVLIDYSVNPSNVSLREWHGHYKIENETMF